MSPVISLFFRAFASWPIAQATLFAISLVMLAPLTSVAEDQRPIFDKAGRAGKIFSHINDWKSMTHVQEPLDLDRLLGESNDSIAQDYAYTAHRMEDYGISGIYLQNLQDIAPLETVLDAFEKAGNDRTVAYFATRVPNASPTPNRSTEANAAAIARGWIEELRPLNELMRSHPNYDRVDGYPVIICYGGAPAPESEWWAAAVDRIEAELGRFIWLRSSHFWNAQTLAEWIPYLDGVTQYSTHGVSFTQFASVAEPMKTQWSDKIFEANAGVVHQSVIQGSIGRDWGYGTGFLRFTLDYALGLQPDSLHVTNWNDMEENSHAAPSYIRWDSVLRIVRAQTRGFRGLGPSEATEPDLIVTNKIDGILGEMLNFEVVGLPMAPGSGTVKLDLRLSDDAGREIHRWDTRTVQYDQLDSQLFRLQSAHLGEGTPPAAVFPVLYYTFRGERHGPYRMRPTRLRVGQAPTDLTWMTPVDAWAPEYAVSWAASLPGDRIAWRSIQSGGRDGEAVYPGGTLVASPGSPRPVFLYRSIAPETRGATTETRILKNGKPYQAFPPRQRRREGAATWFKRAHSAPNSWIELETMSYRTREIPYGSETLTVREPKSLWTSLPIQLAREPSELEMVKLPVALMPDDPRFGRMTNDPRQRWRSLDYQLNEIAELSVPLRRIPVFHYTFDHPNGEMILDSSGYDHHGWIGDRRTRVGHLADGPFGFNFEHFFAKFDMPVLAKEQLSPEAPERHASEDRNGFLRFDGVDDYVFFHARTDMPFVSTVELTLRPREVGRKMIALSTLPLQDRGDQRMTIGLDADGRLLVQSPGGSREFSKGVEELKSKRRLEAGEWAHVAIINNGREIRVFLDGEPIQGAIPTPSWGVWNKASFLYLGGQKLDNNPFKKGRKRQFLWEYRYAGDISDLRITGRPLAPSEFLYSQSPGG